MTQYTYQERFKTLKGVFDEFTNRNLFELESHKVFDKLLGPVKVGKESNIFSAQKGDKKIIIKIYHLQNCNFNHMFDYIRKDQRYVNLSKKRREIIFAWTQREYKNLLKAENGGVRVPKALKWKYNILVEEMIGPPAPALKDQYPAYPYQFLQDILTEVKKLYQCGLIHGDLSAFNILNLDEKPVLIDFSQSTLIKTPNAEELLERDMKNVLQFFNKLGVKEDFDKVMERIKKE